MNGGGPGSGDQVAAALNRIADALNRIADRLPSNSGGMAYPWICKWTSEQVRTGGHGGGN